MSENTNENAGSEGAEVQRVCSAPKGIAPYCFKPGQSGNPAGRKKGSKNTPIGQLRQLMSVRPSERTMEKLREAGIDLTPDEATNAKAWAAVINQLALSGDPAMVKLGVEFLDSKPVQRHEVEQTVFSITAPPEDYADEDDADEPDAD